MERQKKIVDASIAVKWFSKEEKYEKARNILKLHIDKELIIVVPELFYYEISNALRYKKTTQEKVKLALEELFNFQLNMQQISLDIIQASIDISFKYNLTIYDSTYLALAEKLNAKLITEDKKIISLKHPLVEEL